MHCKWRSVVDITRLKKWVTECGGSICVEGYIQGSCMNTCPICNKKTKIEIDQIKKSLFLE